MRAIHTDAVEQAVYQLYTTASCRLPQDVLDALTAARDAEPSPLGRQALQVALDNSAAAAQDGLPLCQDTGLAVVFVELGQQVALTGGLLTDAIQRGIARATADHHLRASVRCPLTGANTTTNTPVPVHITLTEGDRLTLTVAPKGAGSENKGCLRMLTPAAGLQGAVDVVVSTLAAAGGAPCPPVIVGVGIGGNMETCALMAKRALLRRVGQPAEHPTLAAFEAECLQKINALGIGPQGLGGRTTALAVHAEYAPTHIACLPVAVAVQCHVARHAQAVL